MNVSDERIFRKPSSLNAVPVTQVRGLGNLMIRSLHLGADH
jgi:hypothetical protein